MDVFLPALKSTPIVVLLPSSSLASLSTLYSSVLFVFYILFLSLSSFSSVLFVFYIPFIFFILILINMAENGVHEIADQLETLTAQSPAAQYASHVSASQADATEYASQDHFLNAPEGLTHTLLVQLSLILPISMNHSCKMMALSLSRFRPVVIS